MLELSREVMAGLALAFFWIHTLLIAGAAWLDLRERLRLRRQLRPVAEVGEGVAGLFRARVLEGAGPEGVLARNVVEQVGRSKGDGKVHFSDAVHRSELFGGAVEIGGVRVELDAGEASVWPDLQERAAAAAPSSPEQIAEVTPQARRGRGYRREVVSTIGPDRELWVAGRIEQAGEGWRLVSAGEQLGEAVLIAALDPRRWLAQRGWIIVGFIVADITVAGACTGLALWPPVFGLVSMIGGAAALGFFLGVQPLGVSLNEAVRTPDRAYLRGRWG